MGFEEDFVATFPDKKPIKTKLGRGRCAIRSIQQVASNFRLELNALSRAMADKNPAEALKCLMRQRRPLTHLEEQAIDALMSLEKPCSNEIYLPIPIHCAKNEDLYDATMRVFKDAKNIAEAVSSVSGSVVYIVFQRWAQHKALKDRVALESFLKNQCLGVPKETLINLLGLPSLSHGQIVITDSKTTKENAFLTLAEIGFDKIRKEA